MNLRNIIHKSFCVLLFLCFWLCQSRLHAFGNPTHERLTETACNSTEMLNAFALSERNEVIDRLFRGCNIPDAEETSWFMWGHFYDFDTECSDLTKDSALSRMHSHFENAKRLWSAGNRLDAIEELGRGIHYMQDICCMVHVWGRFYNYFNLPTHRTYENALDEAAVAYAHRIAISPNVFDFRFNRGMPIIGVANFYALKTLERYRTNPPSASFWSFFDGPFGVRRAYVGAEEHRGEAKQAVPFEDFELAYQATCELIYSFFQAVGISL